VRKQSVRTGEAGIRTAAVTEQRTVEVPVTHEEVTIECHQVDRRRAGRPIAQTGEMISMPVSEEQVTAEKRAVVYEEVDVGKRAVQERQQASETVRREEAVVDTESSVQIEGEAGTPRPPRPR
jgi:uncharacterized protein (TIGR02271 family)